MTVFGLAKSEEEHDRDILAAKIILIYCLRRHYKIG
jgi:hypothetical protein